MSWANVAFVAIAGGLVALAWAAARAAGVADYERRLSKQAQDAEDEARRVRRDVEREPDPVDRLRNDWSRD